MFGYCEREHNNIKNKNCIIFNKFRGRIKYVDHNPDSYIP